MANIEQQNSGVIWRFFTSREPFIKCNICNVFYESNDIQSDTYLLKKHLEQQHSHIIEEIKKRIKSTWLSQYFEFNIKCESIRCIFCEKDIRVLDGVNLHHHMLGHSIQEHTIRYFKHDSTMIQNLSPEIYTKIIQKKRDDLTSAGLSSYIISHTEKYTRMQCTKCFRQFNITDHKQVIKDHLFLYHNIIIENNASTSTSDQHADAESQTAGNQGELQW